jgi:DNA adenine methylase
MLELKSPYPYFGGKSRIASVIWEHFGDTPNFVDPFFGSGAVLLGRPAEHLSQPRYETANDKDGFISNFWRALRGNPETVAWYADWPKNENDLHARHAWLVGQKENLVARLEGDPDFYDAKIAGWWVWGLSTSIGGGFCNQRGPWRVIDGELRRIPGKNMGIGIQRQIISLGSENGVHRRSLRDSTEWDIDRVTPGILAYFKALAARLRYVQVCSGDWKRVLTLSPTTKLGLTSIILDPPYDHQGRDTRIYTHDDASLAENVRAWAVEHGDNPEMRIAYCGYRDDFKWPSGWTAVHWSAGIGYAAQNRKRQNNNRFRETVWFSPHCLKPGDDSDGRSTLPLF